MSSSTSAKLILYGLEPSPPVRAVLLTLKALNLSYEFRMVDVSAGAHLEPEFVKKNPQHTVPMLEDATNSEKSFYISDSHAICAYLVRKYAQQDINNDAQSLYPKDYYRRAVVDQRLHFETGVLFHTCLKPIQKALFHDDVNEIPKAQIAQIYEAYALLESFLGDNAYVAGETLTIADFSIVSTVSFFHLSYGHIDVDKYPKLFAWLTRMATLDYYEEANLRGARALAERVKAKLPKQFNKLWQKAFEEIKSAGSDSGK